MLDDDLFLAKNQRPALLTSLGVWQFALLPNTLAPNFLDLGTVRQMARARPVYVGFRVASAFNNVAGNLLRPALFVSALPDFSDLVGDPSLTIAQGPELNSTGLAALGATTHVVVPPLNDYISGSGRRYFAAGVMAFVGATDWSAGGLDVFLTPHPLNTAPFNPPAGF